jgi:hypothetical protein
MHQTLADLRLHRLLWAHAAQQIIQILINTIGYEIVSVGYGMGIRNHHTRRALLVHPSGNGSTSGDLALTVPGLGTQPIPRCGQSYAEYLSTVADIVETVARSYLSGTDASEIAPLLSTP